MKCIECNIIWDDNDNYNVESHGLCKSCAMKRLTPVIRKNQLKQGFFDCFGRSSGFCDQLRCKYREICLF